MNALILAVVLKIPVTLPSPQAITVNPKYPVVYVGRAFFAIHNLGVLRVFADTAQSVVHGLCGYGAYQLHPPPQDVIDGDHFQCAMPSLGASDRWLVATVQGPGSWHFRSGAPAVGWHIYRVDGGNLTWSGVALATAGQPWPQLYAIQVVGDSAWVREYSGTSTYRTVRLDLAHAARIGPELPPTVPVQPGIDGVTWTWVPAQTAFVANNLPPTPTPTRTVTPAPVTGLPVCTVTPTCPCVTPTRTP